MYEGLALLALNLSKTDKLGKSNRLGNRAIRAISINVSSKIKEKQEHMRRGYTRKF